MASRRLNSCCARKGDWLRVRDRQKANVNETEMQWSKTKTESRPDLGKNGEPARRSALRCCVCLELRVWMRQTSRVSETAWQEKLRGGRRTRNCRMPRSIVSFGRPRRMLARYWQECARGQGSRRGMATFWPEAAVQFGNVLAASRRTNGNEN